METETIEELKIKCPNCSGSKLTQNVPEMQFDKDYMFCGVCGLVLSIVWIKNTAEILKEAQK